MRRIVLAVVFLLLSPVAAHAAPGDPLPVPVTPVDGATVAAAAEGVELVFTCPNYRQSPAQDEAADSIVGYGVEVSTDPAFGQISGTTAIQRATTDGQCTTHAQAAGGGPLNQPGTYYWRVTRFCFCGSTEAELGPTAAFTVQGAMVRMTAAGPRRAYVGYTALVTLDTDLPDGQTVRLQRKAGSTWKAVGKPTQVSGGRASAPVALGRGPSQVRWLAQRGTQRDVSQPLTITPVAATEFSTGAADTGSYAALGKANVTFQVVKAGREIRNLKAQLTVYCVGGPDVSDNRVVSAVTTVRRVRVAPDGSFYAATTVSKSDTVVRGRLQGGKVTDGQVELAYPLCSGRLDFSASKR